MKLILYKLDRVLIAQYLFILGGMLIIKMNINNNLDTYDHHAILFLYYLGLLTYKVNIKSVH